MKNLVRQSHVDLAPTILSSLGFKVFWKNGPIPASFYLCLFFSNTYLTEEKNCRLQRDSNSNCRSRRQARWTLDHHHVPIRFKSLQVISTFARFHQDVNLSYTCQTDFANLAFQVSALHLHLLLPRRSTKPRGSGSSPAGSKTTPSAEVRWRHKLKHKG